MYQCIERELEGGIPDFLQWIVWAEEQKRMRSSKILLNFKKNSNMNNNFMYKIQKTKKYTEEHLKEKNLTHLHTYSDHGMTYRAVQSLSCTLETNVTMCINSTLI